MLGTATPRRYVPYHLVYPGKRDVLQRKPALERIEALLGPLAWPPLETTIAEVAAALSPASLDDIGEARLQLAV